MLPTLIELESTFGPISLHSYGLLVTLAFCVAFVYIHVRVQRIGIVPDRMIGAYLAAAVGGLVGSHLLFRIAVGGNGFAIYGGVIGGLLAIGAYLHQQQLPVWKTFDVIAPGALMGMGTGRLGCFFAGCCHGTPVHDFHGGAELVFPNGSLWFSSAFPFLATEFQAGGVSRILDTPLYPTQLFAAFAGIGIGLLLHALWTRRTFDGQLLALGLMLEPPTRFLTEAFRADHRGYVLRFPASETLASWFPGMTEAGSELEGATMGLTTSQTLGVLMVLCGAGLYVYRMREGVEEVVPLQTEDDADLRLLADVPD